MICPDPTGSKSRKPREYSSDNSEFSDLMAELKSYQPTASATTQSSFPDIGSDHTDYSNNNNNSERAMARNQRLDICTSDWDILFRAVEERLRLSVGAQPATSAQVRDPGGRVQAIVLECVAELEKLHNALTQERQKHNEG
jgi:hypothetical protein